MFEMLAGRSPFDVVGGGENPDQNTEDYLFQGLHHQTYSCVTAKITRRHVPLVTPHMIG